MIDKEIKYFTLYWMNGTRSIIKGKTIEEAFLAAGYNDEAVKMLDWCDPGITETHYWKECSKKWERYNPINIFHTDFKNFTYEELLSLFNKHHSIIIQLDNKSELSLKQEISCFYPEGWVKYINLEFNEYVAGSFNGESSEGFHFMSYANECLDPDNIPSAILALVNRFSSDPATITPREFSVARSISQIAANQTYLI